MRALVTGAGGFVGSHLVRRLLSDGWTVTATVRGDRRRLPDRGDLQILPFDLTEPWDAGDVDVVFSLAATADPRVAISDPLGAYTNGVRVMQSTLDYAARAGARVLHVSSNEVYANPDYQFGPAGAYAGGKACQEMVCAAHEVPVTVVVTQSLFGERQQRDKLIPTAIRALLTGRPVHLQCDENAWAERPFQHVENLVDALVFLANEKERFGFRDRINLGPGRCYANWLIVRRLAETLGAKETIQPSPMGGRPGHEPDAIVFGNALAPAWFPPVSLNDGLERTAGFYRDNPEWLR